MKALSVRAPWWWYILHGGKVIENRGLQSSAVAQRVTGLVAVHASKWWRPAEVQEAACEAEEMQRRAAGDFPLLPDWKALERFGGCLVGTVLVTGYVRQHASPWFVGDVGIVLANPVALAAPVPCVGRLGFFEVPRSLLGDAA